MAARNAFLASLQNNGVRYQFGGHDHMHHRAIITSPDANARVQEIITSSTSYKFYIPQIPSNDGNYNVPAFGGTRGRRHNADNDTASHILTLWGMADLGSSQTDVYTLAMTMTRTRPVREPKKRALAWIDS